MDIGELLDYKVSKLNCCCNKKMMVNFVATTSH